jgi:hypothetical protein
MAGIIINANRRLYSSIILCRKIFRSNPVGIFLVGYAI